MKVLKENFDDFNIHARIIPSLIVALPIYIYLMINDIIDLKLLDILKNSIFFVALISFYYRIIRNLGKSYEYKMYKELGNKPTTIILSYSDNRIDSITKTRYHKKLNTKIDNLKLPIKKEKETNGDNQLYESAINWLRNYANAHRETEQRTYQELKDYNFWRNLYGSKWIIFFSCIMCIIVEIVKLIMINNHNVSGIIINIAIMLGIILSSCLAITKRTVENKAFDYAKTLLEICERL